MAPVAAELRVPRARSEAGTSPNANEIPIPISAQSAPAIAPPAAADPIDDPRAKNGYAAPAKSEKPMPPTANSAATDGFVWPTTTIAT